MICVGSEMDGFFCRSLCGPWMDCFDGTGAVTSCGCGAILACGPNEVCLPFSADGFPTNVYVGGGVHETAGVCIDAVDWDCDCAASPICP